MTSANVLTHAVELSAHHWGQFTAGRIIAYFAVGIVENGEPNLTTER